MQSDKYLINNLLENMRLRGDHPSCNVQIHPALNSSGSYEAYQCTISVNHNNLYADDANPTNANPGNFEVQDYMWTSNPPLDTPQAPLKSSKPSSYLNHGTTPAKTPMAMLSLEMQLKEINNAEASADAVFRQKPLRPSPLAAQTPLEDASYEEEPKEPSPKRQRKVLFPRNDASSFMIEQ